MSDCLLLDTNIVSFFLKKDTRAGQFETIVKGRILALSFMSVAELYRWTIERSWGEERVEQLETALTRYAILAYDRELGWEWAKVMAQCSQQGITISPSDAWIAATACRYDLPLLTHNLKHFQAAERFCGLQLLRSKTIE